MRKLKTVLLIIVMLCLVCGTLAACNPKGGGPADPGTPDDTTPSNVNAISSTAAYAAFREAALNTYPGNYYNFGLTLGLDYVKDENGRYYSVKIQAAIDPENDENSQLLIELWRTTADGADGADDDPLLGFYYYDGTVVYDCTGIKKGATVVKTQDLNMTAVAKAVNTALGGTSIGSLLIENLLGIELGDLGTVEGLLSILFGKTARMITAADGTVEYQIPLNLASLLSVVGGLLAPDGLLGSYSDLVNQIGDILGLDLSMLPALVDSSAIYMISSVRKGDDGVTRLVSGPTFQIGLDFNTAGTSLEGSVGIIQSELDINLGIDEISVGADAPSINVRDYLVSVRELDIDDLDEYSPLTLELGLELNLDLKKNSFEVQTILASLGSLFGDVSIPEALKTLNIDIAEDTSLTLGIDIAAEINMRDPAGTNLLVTITGKDGKVRGTVAYVGSEQALFADLTGILGRNAKVMVSGFNLNEFLSEQIDGLLVTIRDAIAGLSGSAQQSAQAEYDAAVTEPIANGDIVKYYVASSSDDEPANLDTVGLIQALLGAIEVDMNGDIFNIEGIGVTITKQILNSILSLAGVQGTLPIMGDIRLQYANPGFGETKTIDISGLALGIDDGTGNLRTLLDLGLGMSIRMGTIEDSEAYEKTLAAIRAGNANHEYANLLTFEQLLDINNVDIADILGNVGTVSVDMSLGIDINAIGGDFLEFGYDSDSIVLKLLAAFADEEGIDANAILKLAADINLSSLLATDPVTGALSFNVKGLLDANLYLALLTGEDAEPALELWLNGGVVYLVTDLLGGMNIKVDLAPFLAMADDSQAGGSSSAALTAADGEEGTSLDINLILSLLAGVGVGDTYIDVYLASFTLTQLFGLLGLDLGGATIKLIGEGDGEASIDGGVKIELGDGLNLGQAGIDIYLGIGRNAAISLSLGGFGAGIGANANAIIPEDKANKCAEVLENPFVYLYLEAGMDAYVAAQGIPLGENLGNIVIGEDIDIGYSFEIEGYLDLRPIVAKLFGGEVSYAGNKTQLAIKLSKNDGSDKTVVIGVYYKDGRAYLDLSALGIAPASVEIDLMALIVGLAMADVEPLAGGQALSSADPVEGGNDVVKAAVDLALKIGSKGFSITLVQGLTEILAQYVAGIESMELDALLAVDWSGAEGSDLLALSLGLTDETGKPLASFGLSVGQIGLGIAKELGDGEGMVQMKAIPDDDTLATMTSIGSVVTENYTAIETAADAQAYTGDLFYYWTGAYLPFTLSKAIEIYYNGGNTLYIAQTGSDGSVSYVAASMIQAQAASKVYKDANGTVEYTLADGIALYYADGNKLYSSAIGFNLTLPAVHLELKAEIEMGTTPGESTWTIGSWISNFLGEETDDAIKSFVSQLLVQFQLVEETMVTIGLDLGINLRFNPENIADINYILAHSDLALVVSATDADGLTEELLSLYVIANEDTGKSTLYVATKSGGLIDGLKVKVPDIDLGALVGNLTVSDDTAQGQALSANAYSSADGDTSGEGDVLSVLEGLLANCIYSIVVNNSGVTLSLGASLVAYVLSLIPATGVPSPTDPGFQDFADSFVQLNPAKSYLSLFVGDNAGGLGGKFALEVGLGIDPVYFSLGLGGLNIDFAGDELFGNGTQTEEEFFADYTSLYDIEALSLDLTVDLNLALKNTNDNEDGTLDVGALLDALIGEALVTFGLEIPEDLILGAELYVGANLSFNSAEDTQIVLELRDTASRDTVFGVYLDGPTLWVRGGVLPIGNFVVENTGFAQLIVDTVNELLAELNDDKADGTAEAMTAADEAASDSFDIFLELANERIALSLTETFIVALISAIAGDGAQTATDIAGIIEKLNLGAEVKAEVDFSTFTIDIGLTSNLIDLGLKIVEPRISLSKSDKVTTAIGSLNPDDFNSYSTSTKVKATVDLTLDIDLTEGDVSLSDLIDVALGLDSVQAGLNGYDELITANDAVAAAAAGTKLYKFVDGVAEAFVGTEAEIRDYYVSTGKSLYQAGGVAAGTGRDVLNALLNSLGLELILSENITTDIGIHIEALLDLTALGDFKPLNENDAKALLKKGGYLYEKATDGSYGEFAGDEAAITSVYAGGGTLYTFGALVDSIFAGDFASLSGGLSVNFETLLGALEAYVQLRLNNTYIDIYFAGGMLYIDLTTFGGSKIALDVMWLIDALSASDDAAGSSEAMTADGETPVAESNTTNVILGLVNAIIKSVSLQTAVTGVDGNLFKGGLSLKAMLGSEVLSLVFSQLIGEEVTVEDLLFGDDANLTLKLQPQDNGNKLLELGLHAPTESGVTVDLGLGAGLKASFADPTVTLISQNERAEFTDVTGIVENILAIVNGTATDAQGSQYVMFSVMGRVYFDVNGNAQYELGDTVNSLIGSLLAVYIENLVFNLNIDESATAGIGFRLTAGLDVAELAAIDFNACKTDGALDFTKFLKAFLTEVPSLKIALELIELDETLNFAKYSKADAEAGYVKEGDYVVKGGIYIQNGNLYLDGTSIFGVAENYSFVPNFTKFVADLIEVPGEGDGSDDAAEGSALSASVDAYSSADTVLQRNALLQVIASSKTLKIVITKSILSVLLVTLMPDLGDITDVFDKLDVSLGLDAEAPDEIFINLGIDLGKGDSTQSIGLSLGGIVVEFGEDADRSVVPEYITAQKSPDGSTDVPLTAFYDSIIRLSTSIELELGITEGTLDFGGFLKDILGDLSGVVIDMPATAKGYSSAHIRLDLAVMLDMYDPAQSEIYIEVYNLSNEAGAEVKWLGVYYTGMTLYLDLAFFGLPRIAVPLTLISDYIDEYLGFLLDSDIYNTVVIDGSSSAEGLTAADEPETESLTLQEKTVKLLISKRTVVLSLGNYMLRYVLSLFDIGGKTLEDLVYENLEGGLDLSINYDELLNLEIGAYLELEGDRFVPVTVTAENVDAINNAIADGEEYYGQFVRYTADDAVNIADYAYTLADEEAGTYRLLSTSDKNSGNAGNADFPYVAPEDRYKSEKLSSVSVGTVVYQRVAGDALNKGVNDMHLALDLGIKNFELSFITEREPLLTGDELKSYMDFNTAETVTVSETISLDLLFAQNASDISLVDLLNYLFEGSSEELEAFITAAGLSGGDLNRAIDVVVALEFRLGAFLNYLRSLDAQFDLRYGTARDQLLSLGENVDLITFVNAITAVVGAKKVPNASGSIYYVDNNVDDLVGLEDLLEFVNASVRIVTNGKSADGNDDGTKHDILGVYFVGGEFVEATADTPDSVQRYSNFFRSETGIYGYVDGMFKLISEIEKGDENGSQVYSGDRYGYDAAYMYPNDRGTYIRKDAGLYVDLSYLGQPSVYMALSELQNFIGSLMSDSSAASEALTADGGSVSASSDDEVAPPSISLGSFAESLPLLSSEIASYIKAFLYGVRMTSSFIQVLLQTDYVNSLLGLLMGESSLLPEGTNQPYLTIYTDVNNYNYTYAGDVNATADRIKFADTRFHINLDNENGLYYLAGDENDPDARLALRSTMSESEAEEYQARVDKGDAFYYAITPIVTYIYLPDDNEYVLFSEATAADKRNALRYTAANVGKNGVTEAMIDTYVFYEAVETAYGVRYNELDYHVDTLTYDGNEVFFVYPLAEQNPLIEVGLYLWDYKATLSINLPETDALDYSYVAASAEEVAAGIGLYEKSPVYVYESANMIVDSDDAFIYYRGNYHPVYGNLYVRGTASYDKVENQNDYTLDGTYYVACTDSNIIYYVALNADNYYQRVMYDEIYTPVSATNGGMYYVREARDTTEIYQPDMFVDFSVAYKFEATGGATATNVEIRDLTGIHPNSLYRYDESADRWDAVDGNVTGNIYMGNEILHVWDASSDRFVSYAEYGAHAGNVTFYIAEPIKYVDSSELYTISLTLRGSLSISGIENYMTDAEYKQMFGEAPAADAKRYTYDAGVYKESVGGEYVKVSGSRNALGDILGGIVGDLSSLLIVGEGYKAEILFEIKAQVSLEYGEYGIPGTDAVSTDTLWLSEVDLAIDTWLRLEYDNGDEYLRHFVGIYYDTDPETGSTALYLDLTWLLGSGAKFKIDMSAFSLEDLIQSKGGIFGLFGQGSAEGEALTAAGGEAGSADEVVLTDTDVASVILGIYTRRIALQASAGLVRLLVGLIAPDASETIAAILPNVVAEVEIGMAPYNLNIGLDVYDDDGKYGILGVGITLNLFDASNRNNGTRLDLGATEDFLETDAELLQSNSSDYIFYQALYTALLNGEKAPAGSTTYISSPDATKGYIAKSDYEGDVDVDKLGAIEYVRNDKVTYNLVDEVYYSYVRADYNSRYALVPSDFSVFTGSVFTRVDNGEGKPTYILYSGAINAEADLYVSVGGGNYKRLEDAGYYFYTYDYATGGPKMVPYTKANYDAYVKSVLSDKTKANAPESVYNIYTGSSAVGARLYEYLGSLSGANFDAYVGDAANYTKAVMDTFGAHKSESVFGSFGELLSLDLNALLNREEGSAFGVGDIADLLTVEDMELTLSLDLNMQFKEIINWTQQMTELLAVDGQEKEYFKFLLQSATLNQAEFLSYIGGKLVLSAYIKGESVKAALKGMADTDTMTMIKTMLAGAEICIQLYYDSNYNGTPLEEPLTVWITFGELYVTDGETGEQVINPNMGAASVYINGGEFAKYIGLADKEATAGTSIGNFFDRVKLTNIDIFSLLAGDEASGSAEGMTAVGGTVNDGEATDTGLIPSNIWSYIGMALGYVMIADNTIGIGLAETLAANAVELLVSKFTGSEYLPKLTVTYDVDSSGVAIIFGDTPSININLGVQSGGNYFATADEIKQLLTTDTQAATNYNITDATFEAIVGKPVLAADGSGGYRFVGEESAEATHYLIADDDYAVAAYACSEYVWLGTRYTLVADANSSSGYRFEPVADPYENAFSASSTGGYVRLNDADVSDTGAFRTRYESDGTVVKYDTDDYVALNTYLRVTGMSESDVSDRRYNLNAALIKGEYLKLGDFRVSMSLGNLGIKVNQGAATNPAPVDESYTDFAKEGGIRISTSVDVSFYGAEGEQVDLSSLLDFIIGLIGVQGVSNNDLRLNITSALGYEDNPYFNVKLDIFVDVAKLLKALLGDGTNKDTSDSLQLALSIRQYELNSAYDPDKPDSEKYVLGDVLIGVYLVDDTLYIDLSALLGSTAKVNISELNIIDLIMGATGNDTTASESAEAFTAGIKDVLNATSHDYAYLGALVNPGYFSLQLTMAAVEAILGKVSENMPDKGIPTSLIDIGDIIIEAYGDRADGDMLSIGVKFSDGFAGQLAIQYLHLGTKDLKSVSGILPTDLTTEGVYINVFNYATRALGKELTIGVKAQAALNMTSTGLSRYPSNPAENYVVLSSAAEAKVYNNRLYKYEGGEYKEWTIAEGADRDAEIDKYYASGKLYYNKYDTSLAGWAVDLIVGLLGPSLEGTLGTIASDKINVTFADDDLNLVIDLTADINIAAIMKYGLAGILFSDLKLDVKLVDFNRSLLKIYYLGSSRLKSNGSYYTLQPDGSIFADSLYIDASGLGFGLIKFSGLTGLVGGSTGGMYDVQGSTSSAALSAADGDESASKDDNSVNISGLALAVNIADGYVGINLGASLIDFVFGMIGGDIAQYIPDIQELNLNLSFADDGIQQISINSTLDKAGTGLQLSIGNFEVGLGGVISDEELTDLTDEVKEGYAGLTYSASAGIGPLIGSILESLDPNLTIQIDRKGASTIESTYRTFYRTATKVDNNSHIQLNLSRVPNDSGVNGQDPAYRLVLGLSATRNDMDGIDTASLSVHLTSGGMLYVDSGSIIIGGAAIVEWILSNFVNPIELNMLVETISNLTKPSDSLPSWSAPQGATAAAETAAVSASDEVAATTAATSNVSAGTINGSGADSSYSPSLKNLIEGIEINLFNSNGYQPYISTMTSAPSGEGGTRYISLKIEFNKDAFNELLILIHYMLVNMLAEAPELASIQTLFIYSDSAANGEELYYDVNTSSANGNTLPRNISAMRAILADTTKTTQQKVEAIAPYSKSLPWSLLSYVLDGGLLGIDNGIVSFGQAWSALGNLACLIASILPLPFASYDRNAPNPSANIYIDLSPEASVYGLSDRVVLPGLQAIELMINCEKNGYGSNMSYYSATSGRTSNIANATEAMVLSINPRNLVESNTNYSGTGALGFLEAISASIDGGQSPVPTEVVITDPATRTGNIVTSNGTFSNVVINGSTLGNAKYFPQNATANYVNGQNSSAGNLGGTGIIWDAASVDYVAATVDASTGRRLAGYIYGYALNIVVAAVPVYVDNTYALNKVEAYVDYNGDDAREFAGVKLDVSSFAGTELPDLVRFTFENGKKYIFATVLKNDAGEALTAVRRVSGGYEQVTSGETTSYKTYSAYKAYAEVYTGDTANTDAYMTVGGVNYVKVTLDGVEYLVLSNKGQPITQYFPVGEITWGSAEFTWSSSETIEIEMSYKWGNSSTATTDYVCAVVANNATGIAQLTGASDALTLNEQGNTVTLNLDILLAGLEVADYRKTILDAFSELNNVLTVKLGENSSAKLHAEWDLTALESAIDALAVKVGGEITNYDFYKGLRADVTLWLGGKTVEGGKAFYNNPDGLFKGSGAVYNDENDVNYADEGYIAQAFTLAVVVDSNVVDEVVGGLMFVPYDEDAAALEVSDFYDDTVKILFADGTTRTLTVSGTEGGNNITPVRLCVIDGNGEKTVWNNTGDKPASYVLLSDLMKEISYKGYTGKYGDIYLVGTIGTGIVGVQTVYLPVTVASLAPVYGTLGYITTSTAGTELDYDARYAVDVNGNFVYSKDGGKTYKLADGQHSFPWNFLRSDGVTEPFTVYLNWNAAKFYTDGGFNSEIALGNLLSNYYYFAIVPISVKDTDGNDLGLSNVAGAEYQTIKVQLYFAGRDIPPAEGSSLSVTGPFPSSGYVFDKDNIPSTTLYKYIVDSLGTQLDFVSSQVGNVTVSIDSVNFGDFAGRMKDNLQSVASAGGYSKTVTYSFTATAENGKQYKFSGSLKISVPSTKPVEPVVNPVLTDISDIRLATLVVDPFAYASFDAFAAAFKEAYADKTFTANNGGTVVNGTFNSLSFSKVGYADDNSAQLPLAGGTYDDVRVDFTTADGTKYYAFVTVIITNREVSDYEFVLNGFTDTVTRAGYGAVETITWFNASTGAVVNITTNSAGLPTEINILNPFAFNWETIFGEGSGLLVTLADTGEEVLLKVDNPFVDGVGDFSLSIGYTNEALTLSLSNHDVNVAFNITVKFTVSPARLTMYNTNLASDTLAYDDLKYYASVYGYESKDGKVVPSVYDLLKGTEEFVWYVDGMFVKASTVKTYVDMEYSVLSGEKGYYTYNYSRGAYTLAGNDGKYVFVYSAKVDMTAKWDHTNLSYSFAGGVRDTYAEVSVEGTTFGDLSTVVTVPVNIYSSELATVEFVPTGYDDFGEENVARYEDQTIEATYYHIRKDEEGNEYPVNPADGTDVAAGANEEKLTLDNKNVLVFGNPATAIYFVHSAQAYTAEYKVVWTEVDGVLTKGTPELIGEMVKVGDATDGKVYFVKDGGENRFDLESGEFYFDPLSGIDPFEQVTLDMSVGQMTVYKWFPLAVSAVSAVTKVGEDEVQLTNSNLYVGWTLSDFVFNFEGGSYRAVITLKETSMNGGTNVIPEQRFTPGTDNINVTPRVVTAVNTGKGDYAALSALTGFVKPSGSSGQTYIDPYNFDIAVFRRAVGDINSLTFTFGGTDTLGGTEHEFSTASDDYKLAWDFSEFSVSYLGGVVNLKALITLPDGSTQTYSFPFLVTRVLVNNMTGIKGGTFGSAVVTNVNANLGEATQPFVIDPFVPSSLSLPKGWQFSLISSNPTIYDVETGEVSDWTTATDYGTIRKDYVAVMMPSFEWTWSLVTAASNTFVGYATIQVEDGQRIKVPVTIRGNSSVPSHKPTSTEVVGGLRKLETSFTEGGRTYSVVWVGKATVVGGSEYKVTFASAGSEYIVQRKGQRKVTYNLTAYVGAVVDANGNVLIYNADGTPAAIATYIMDSFDV